MENDAAEGNVQKQAVIIDSLYHPALFLENLASSGMFKSIKEIWNRYHKGSLLALAGSIFLAVGLVTAGAIWGATSLVPALIGDASIVMQPLDLSLISGIFGLGAALILTPQAVERFPTRFKPKYHFYKFSGQGFNIKENNLGSLTIALAKKGYAVSVLHEFNMNWKNIFNHLAQEADENTTTLMYYSGHGKIKKGVSTLDNKKLSADAFVSGISKIPGDKIAVIDACEAGGFADPSKLSDKEKERLVVVTASDKKEVYVTNPLPEVIRTIVEGKNAEPFIVQFNRENSKIPEAIKSKTKYEPRIAFGKKASAIKI